MFAGKQQHVKTLLPMSVGMSEFCDFLETPLGEALLNTEQQQLAKQLVSITGYNCLQLSVKKGAALCQAANMGHPLQMGYAPRANDEPESENFWADYQQFPIASDCIDVILLHHVLEFSHEPHQLLREADRTLTAGGHLLLFGFNPFSCWPLCHHWYRWRNRHSGVSHTIRQGRLTDWLSLLNYDVIHRQTYGYQMPLNSERWVTKGSALQRLAKRIKSPFGMVYFIVARKRSMAVTPLMTDWREQIKTPRAVPSASRQTKFESIKEPSEGIN
jgi:SAM-dependent methyltransferase